MNWQMQMLGMYKKKRASWRLAEYLCPKRLSFKLLSLLSLVIPRPSKKKLNLNSSKCRKAGTSAQKSLDSSKNLIKTTKLNYNMQILTSA